MKKVRLFIKYPRRIFVKIVLAFSIFLVFPVSSFCQRKPSSVKFSLADGKREAMSAFTSLQFLSDKQVSWKRDAWGA